MQDLDRQPAERAAEDSRPAGAPTKTQCRNCGTRNDPDAKFCKSCGAALSARAPEERR